MSEIDGIRTGITSSSITVFTTFLSTLLVEEELTTIFAATFSVMLANGISDAFAVGTSLKDGIDLTRDRLLVRDIIVSELIYTFPIVVFVGILAILQRKKVGPSVRLSWGPSVVVVVVVVVVCGAAAATRSARGSSRIVFMGL